jgi:Fe-S-cluster-containing hydrogenase component 2
VTIAKKLNIVAMNARTCIGCITVRFVTERGIQKIKGVPKKHQNQAVTCVQTVEREVTRANVAADVKMHGIAMKNVSVYIGLSTRKHV